MSVSARGAFAIAQAEDLVPAPYYDSAGVLTWGIGHTAHAGLPNPATLPMSLPANLDSTIREAWWLFEKDLLPYTREVLKALGPVTSHELDGWVMWHFNTGGIHTTSAVRKWRSGDKAGAVAVLQQWNKITVKGKKVVSDGLVARRKQEADIILRGVYPGGKLDVFPTDGKGRVIWKALASYDYRQWSDFIGARVVDADRVEHAPKTGAGGIVSAILLALSGVGVTLAAFWEKLQGWF